MPPKTVQQAILEALSESNEPLGPKQIAERVQHSYGSVRNAVGPMADDGVIVRDDSDRYPRYHLAAGAPVRAVEVRSSDDDDRLVAIPILVDIEAAAAGPEGGFLVDTEAEEYEFSGVNLPASYIRQEYGVSPDRVLYIWGRGTSMVPTINPGQRVMIALLPEATQVRDGLIYVVRFAGSETGLSAILVKRLYVTPDHIHVHADNDDVEDYFVPYEVWDRDYALLALVLETAVRH